MAISISTNVPGEMTWLEIGQELGISADHTRKIYLSAMRKLLRPTNKPKLQRLADTVGLKY